MVWSALKYIYTFLIQDALNLIWKSTENNGKRQKRQVTKIRRGAQTEVQLLAVIQNALQNVF